MAAAVIIALVAGVFAGALVVWLALRGQSPAAPGLTLPLGEIADPAGRPARDAAHAMLTNLCEYTLHLADFEPVLAAL